MVSSLCHDANTQLYADDLNSLYVYEAKMSLLTRMSQTRAGAERLLEARLIPILADCDFIDTRPESDKAFVGASRSFARRRRC